MSDKSKIEWCDASWNPVTGCTKVSEGCRNCYALTFAERWRGTPGHYFENGFDITLRPDKLDQPLKWKKSRKIFVNSMSDLFHESVPDEFIAKVWDVMWACPQHTFQILTKRPERMMKWVSENAFMMDFGWTEDERKPMVCGLETHIDTLFGRNRCGWANSDTEKNNGYGCDHPEQEDVEDGQGRCFSFTCPIACETEDESEEMKLHSRPRYAFAKNVWLGTSVENQKTKYRMDILREVPAAVRFISGEPLLEDLGELNLKGINWFITGSESGPRNKIRAMDEEWVLSIRDQCLSANVPFFYKQNVVDGKKISLPELEGKQWAQFPQINDCQNESSSSLF